MWEWESEWESQWQWQWEWEWEWEWESGVHRAPTHVTTHAFLPTSRITSFGHSKSRANTKQNSSAGLSAAVVESDASQKWRAVCSVTENRSEGPTDTAGLPDSRVDAAESSRCKRAALASRVASLALGKTTTRAQHTCGAAKYNALCQSTRWCARRTLGFKHFVTYDSPPPQKQISIHPMHYRGGSIGRPKGLCDGIWGLTVINARTSLLQLWSDSLAICSCCCSMCGGGDQTSVVGGLNMTVRRGCAHRIWGCAMPYLPADRAKSTAAVVKQVHCTVMTQTCDPENEHR